MGEVVRIEELAPSQVIEWDEYVDQHPQSTCYHLGAWKKIATEAYGLRAPFLVARRGTGGRLCGALPLFIVGGLVPKHLTNALFGAYGAVLADDAGIRLQLLERARDLSHSEDASYLLLKTLVEPEPAEESDPAGFGAGSRLSPEFTLHDGWVIATLGLHPDPQKIWTGLRDKIRNCVRKAKRFGLRVRSGQGELRQFYSVLARNMHSKGAPIYGYGFIRRLAERLGPQSDVITLWHENRCVAGAFLIFHKRTLYVPFASSLPSSLHMSPNNLLYWEIIRAGCRQGASTLDFGRSLRNSGSLRFKQGWGARILRQPCLVYSPRSRPLNLDPNDIRARLFVRGWQRLPLGVVNALGPAICRQLAGLI